MAKHVTKKQLQEAVAAAKEETRTAIETMYGALNAGQKKKIAKDEKVKALFDRHGVKHDEA